MVKPKKFEPIGVLPCGSGAARPADQVWVFWRVYYEPGHWEVVKEQFSLSDFEDFDMGKHSPPLVGDDE